MNIELPSLLLASSIVVLLEALSQLFARNFRQNDSPGFQVGPLTGDETSFMRAVVRLFAGGGIIWGLAELESSSEIVLSGVLLVLFLMERLVSSAKRQSQSGEIAFFDSLLAQVASGQDFFAALAAANDHLSDGASRESVSLALRRFSERRNLAFCLEPIVDGGPFLAGLVADVQRAGWENSSALQLSVHQMHERVAAAWEKGHRSRIYLRGLEKRKPMLLQSGLGMALMYLVFHLEMFRQVENGILIGGLVIVVFSLVYGRRTIYLGLSSGIFIILLWALLMRQPPLAFDWVSSKYVEQGVLGQRIKIYSKQITFANSDGEAPPQFCQVLTGFNPGWAHLRSGPAMSAGAIGLASEGDLLQVLLQHDSEWLNVRSLDGAVGWIYSSLCEVVHATP